MKFVAEFDYTPVYLVVENGTMGRQPVFRIKRIRVNGQEAKLQNYHYSTEHRAVVSTAMGEFSKAKILKCDKYRKISVRENIPGTAFARNIKISLDEIQYAADMTMGSFQHETI
jgi:hypothetical protein